jgi:hypothetical protein
MKAWQDSANLPDPEVIAADIAEDLQAALDQPRRHLSSTAFTIW